MLALSVTTCVVVWIEIMSSWLLLCFFQVTTCVVVWIEMLIACVNMHTCWCHHLRGGVD